MERSQVVLPSDEKCRDALPSEPDDSFRTCPTVCQINVNKRTIEVERTPAILQVGETFDGPDKHMAELFQNMLKVENDQRIIL